MFNLANIPGLSPNGPTTTNAAGCRQSALAARFDLIDPGAFFVLAQTLHQGAEKYSDEGWRTFPTNVHLNHALMHAYAYLAGDTRDHHLEQAFCRMMMALAMHQAASNKQGPNDPPLLLAGHQPPRDLHAEAPGPRLRARNDQGPPGGPPGPA